MNRLLKKKISLVAAAAAMAGGPTTVGARRQRQRQRQRGGGGRGNFFPHHTHQHQSDDRALRIDGDANARAAIDAVPDVASIVNGTATGGPRSYMVGLTRKRYNLPNDDEPAYFTNCGGTLIGPTIVLTAAHCMYPLPDRSWDPVDQVLVNLYDKKDLAGVGAINIQDPSEGGKDIVVHPNYNDATAQNDIALMFLPFAVGQVGDYAKPNDDPHDPVVSNPMTVMGWGLTVYQGSYSDVLLETTVNYISNQECQEIYAGAPYPITDGNICAYKKYSGVCKGDSGGPLFLEKEHGEIGDHPTQVGISSWVKFPCASPGYPDVYTRVSYYEDWIKETVCSRSEHATKELCGSSKSGKSTKSSSHAPPAPTPEPSPAPTPEPSPAPTGCAWQLAPVVYCNQETRVQFDICPDKNVEDGETIGTIVFPGAPEDPEDLIFNELQIDSLTQFLGEVCPDGDGCDFFNAEINADGTVIRIDPYGTFSTSCPVSI